MPKPKDQNCWNCKFLGSQSTTERGLLQTKYMCVRYPPEISSFKGDLQFPLLESGGPKQCQTTLEGIWCGEWQVTAK
jgi:hypothetical protein